MDSVSCEWTSRPAGLPHRNTMTATSFLCSDHLGVSTPFHFSRLLPAAPNDVGRLVDLCNPNLSQALPSLLPLDPFPTLSVRLQKALFSTL